MFKTIFNAWKNNHGIQLLLIGSCVGLLMCLLWSQQWLPEIRFRQPEATVRAQSLPSPKCYFVARIETNASKKQTLGGLLLFSPYAANATDRPTNNSPVVFDADGTATIVIELDPGEYAAVVYLDENGNGQMDIDETGKAIEPFRTSNPRDAKRDWRDLTAAIFRLDSSAPKYTLMQFND